MMHRECTCFHHKFSLLMNFLSGIAAILFFWTSLSATPVWGLDDLYYFQTVIVLAIVAHGTKYCKCCNGHGAGYNTCHGCNMVCEECNDEKKIT